MCGSSLLPRPRGDSSECNPPAEHPPTPVGSGGSRPLQGFARGHMCLVLPFPTLPPPPLAGLSPKAFPTYRLQGSHGPRTQRGTSGHRDCELAGGGGWRGRERGAESPRGSWSQGSRAFLSVCLPVSDSLTSPGTLVSTPGAASLRLLSIPRRPQPLGTQQPTGGHRQAACAPLPLLWGTFLLSGAFLYPWGLSHCNQVTCLAQAPHCPEPGPEKDPYPLHPGCTAC